MSTTSSISFPFSACVRGFNRARKIHSPWSPAFSTASSTSAPTSCASSFVSSVITGRARTPKWTSTSAPSASRRITLDRIRRRAGASETSDASSMSSGRIPITTGLPSDARSAGRAANTSSGISNENPPNVTTQEPFSRARSASTMFMAGEPMKPATNRFSGWS